MTIGKEKIITKYQKDADSPVLDLVANIVGEAFLCWSLVVSLRSPSALPYTSDSPKEQTAVWTKQPPTLELTTRPIDIAELIKFTKTQDSFNTIANIAWKKYQSLLEALLRFKNYYHLREEIIEVGTAIFHNIQQQKKVEDEAKKLHVLLEGTLEKLANIWIQHSR